MAEIGTGVTVAVGVLLGLGLGWAVLVALGLSVGVAVDVGGSSGLQAARHVKIQKRARIKVFSRMRTSF